MRRLIKKIPRAQNLISIVRKLRQRLIYGYPWWLIQRRRLMRRSEMSLSKFAAKFLGKGDVVCDIGANMGYTSVLMASCVEETGFVYAFEPNPVCFVKLEQSAKIAWHKNLFAYLFALSDDIGQITLQIDLREGSGASTIVAEYAERESAWHEAKYSTILVNTTTLDSFCEKSKIMPIFIKIDVEGAEDKVIQGGKSVITDHHPLIWFECWCGQENNTQINKNLGHLKFLSNIGYKFFLATILKFNGKWTSENSPLNPSLLLPLELQMLENLPASGFDILAAMPNHLNRLQNCGLISESNAKAHLQEFGTI